MTTPNPEQRNDAVSAIVRKAVYRALRAEVDPARSLDIEYRRSERGEAIATATREIATLSTEAGSGEVRDTP